jgi:hypothetical protein
MSKIDPAQGYVVMHEGDQPDPAKAQPFLKAAAAFLKGAATDPATRLYDTVTGISYSPADADVVRLVYFSQLRPEDMEVRSVAGRTLKSVQTLQEALHDLARHKSGGLFVPADEVWLIPPPEINPEFEQQVALLQRELPEMETEAPMASIHPRTGWNGHGCYPVELHDDMDLLRASGEKMLNATMPLRAR